jgi:hypothetical protein
MQEQRDARSKCPSHGPELPVRSRHIPAVFLLRAQAMDHFNGGLPCLGDLAGQCAAQDDANLVRPIARFPFVKGTPYQEGEYYSST